MAGGSGVVRCGWPEGLSEPPGLQRLFGVECLPFLLTPWPHGDAEPPSETKAPRGGSGGGLRAPYGGSE